ncbi:hypothetical protein [Vibrio metschnikovii]|uniref:hypothetical protein n=1 Tax=Vibrio metschnikovii TaxID=28172 RepID=UPI001C311024|nr:hypothetical protein [Vibrio metschnikovii]
MSDLFEADKEYKVTFRNHQNKKISFACSLDNTTPESLIKRAVTIKAKGKRSATKS